MECMICGGCENVRNVNLYIVGSEGLNICHECEMDLLTHIRSMRIAVNRGKIIIIQQQRKLRGSDE